MTVRVLALSCSPIWMVPDVLFLSNLGCHGVGERYMGEAVRLGKGSPVGEASVPMGATTSRLRVTLLSLFRQTDEFFVAIATKRPVPKDNGNRTVFTQLLIQVPFSTWFYRRVCVHTRTRTSPLHTTGHSCALQFTQL